MIARPDPLVPAEVDLRDFAFMPLDVVRLRDSGLAAKASGDEFRAAVLLWCASWHQQPAASLPNDDEELANLCGYSRAMREWHKVKKGAMRGWIECSDGRLYHPTVAAKARDAWDSKLAQRARTEAARRAREAKRQTLPQALSQSQEKSVTEDVTASKGQGQGQGQGYSVPNGTDAVPASPASPPTPKDRVYAFGVPLLTASGVSDKNARSMLAGLCKRHGDAAVADAIDRCAEVQAIEPVSWLQAALGAGATRSDAGNAQGRTGPEWARQRDAAVAAYAGPFAAKPVATGQQAVIEEVVNVAARRLG